MRSQWVTEHRWGGAGRPLPRQWVFPAAADSRALARPAADGDHHPPPFDFTARITRLCHDVSRRCPELSHVDSSAVLFTFTPSRNRSAFGLQARVTPMRFRDGRLTCRIRNTVFQVQRYFVDGREMLYLVTFCLPRFLDQSFEQKLITVFHELYHISPRFDGDLRRHGGRYDVHSRSKRAYDERMMGLVKAYLSGHPDPSVYGFLRFRTTQLWRAYGGITGVSVPRPKMLPVRAGHSETPARA